MEAVAKEKCLCVCVCVCVRGCSIGGRRGEVRVCVCVCVCVKECSIGGRRRGEVHAQRSSLFGKCRSPEKSGRA